MRQEYGGLADLGHPARMKLGDHDSQRNRQRDADEQEYGIVAEGIAENIGNIRRAEQELKVLHAHPFARNKQAVEKTLAGLVFVILECKDDAEHRHIAKRNQPCNRRQ